MPDEFLEKVNAMGDTESKTSQDKTCARILRRVNELSKMPQDGDIRVVHIPQVPMQAFTVLAESFEEADLISRVLTEYDLFQYGHKVKPDYCNASFVQIYHAGEWFDVDDDCDPEDSLCRDHPPQDFGHRFDIKENRKGLGKHDWFTAPWG